jgi:hypothetical protein
MQTFMSTVAPARLIRALALSVSIAVPGGLAAQASGADTVVRISIDTTSFRTRMFDFDDEERATFRSRADSLDWERNRGLAERAKEFRVVVSLFDRQLWVILGDDTLRTAPVAVASGLTLDYAGQTWAFRTPRGRHNVLRKVSEPVWTPPDWLYAEVASEHGLKLARLPVNKPVRLSDGRTLAVRSGLVGLVDPYSDSFMPLPTDEHIVFDDTLYIPPFTTLNRRVHGELGRFALDLGDGYMIHGTPDESSVGKKATHGCLRLHDEDIEWMYQHVKEGTPVYVY